MAGKQVKGGILGCGAISKLHITSMLEAGIEVTALCDINEKAMGGRNGEFLDRKAKQFTDLNEMLKENIDVVAVLTPPFLHKDQVVACLNAGKIPYCEKPVVFRLEEFDEIFEAEKSSGKNSYFTPGRFRSGQTPMMKQYIDNGNLGKVYRLDAKHFRWRGRPGVDQNFDSRWFADSKKGIVGIMGDMGLYFMDCSFHLTGWPKITSVSAVAFKEFPFEMPEGIPYDVEEHVVILARTENKLTYTFEFANIARLYEGSKTTMDIMGTEGGLQSDNWVDTLKFVSEKGGPWKIVEEKTKWKEGKKGDVMIYEELAAEVNGGEPCKTGTSSEQMFRLHEMLAMAFLSSAENKEIKPEDLDHTRNIYIAP